jgi:hypothetical protein
MLYFERGTATDTLTEDDLRTDYFRPWTRSRPATGARHPSDFTRYHSHAGVLTKLIYDYFGDRLTDVLPALAHTRP